VPAGARITVPARLLAPRWPGIYWLQWDMVEEGVTWFAQVSPRQPRALVLVAPPPAWLVAPLPLAIAIAALVMRRIALADVVWCAAALGVKPLILARDALLEPTPVSYWLAAAIAIAVPAAALLIFPQRVRPWVLLVAGMFGSLLLLADDVYYRFFGDVLSTPALLAAHQAGHVWGSVGSLLTPGLVWLVIDWPFACAMSFRVSRMKPVSPRRRAAVAAVAAVSIVVGGAVVSAPRVLAAAPLDQMFRARAVVEELGPFGFHAYDAWNYTRSTWLHTPATHAEIEDELARF
jgi:phosphoglycerol transferase MdoB-like AlkP superfamily enzyme